MRTFNLLLFIAFLINPTFGQTPSEEIKKNINDFLYKTLHDFKSYEPIEFSETKEVFTTLEEDSKYIEYFKYIEKLSLDQKQLDEEISRTRLLEKDLVKLKEELAIAEKADYSSLDSISEDQISTIYKNNPYLKKLYEQLDGIKQGKPIPGKEYLSKKTIGKKEKEWQADLVAREIEAINRQIDSQNSLLTAQLAKMKSERIQGVKSQIRVTEILLLGGLDNESNRRENLPELEKQRLRNKENLSKAEGNFSEFKRNFKPEHIGYAISHRFRANHALGASVNNLKCFITDKKYNIIDVFDSSCF